MRSKVFADDRAVRRILLGRHQGQPRKVDHVQCPLSCNVPRTAEKLHRVAAHVVVGDLRLVERSPDEGQVDLAAAQRLHQRGGGLGDEVDLDQGVGRPDLADELGQPGQRDHLDDPDPDDGILVLGNGDLMAKLLRQLDDPLGVLEQPATRGGRLELLGSPDVELDPQEVLERVDTRRDVRLCRVELLRGGPEAPEPGQPHEGL